MNTMYIANRCARIRKGTRDVSDTAHTIDTIRAVRSVRQRTCRRQIPSDGQG